MRLDSKDDDNLVEFYWNFQQADKKKGIMLQSSTVNYSFLNEPSAVSFCLFSVSIKQTFKFLELTYVKICPSNIQCWNLNPKPSYCESHPITTSPGLPLRELFFHLITYIGEFNKFMLLPKSDRFLRKPKYYFSVFFTLQMT